MFLSSLWFRIKCNYYSSNFLDLSFENSEILIKLTKLNNSQYNTTSLTLKKRNKNIYFKLSVHFIEVQDNVIKYKTY